MVRIGGSPGGSTPGGWSSSAKPFLNDLMPLATSPMMSEILPLPPNTSNTTAPTMSQCQIDRPPMTQISVSNARQAERRPIRRKPRPSERQKQEGPAPLSPATECARGQAQDFWPRFVTKILRRRSAGAGKGAESSGEDNA